MTRIPIIVKWSILTEIDNFMIAGLPSRAEKFLYELSEYYGTAKQWQKYVFEEAELI